jgi:short-subunit dehydrogenase
MSRTIVITGATGDIGAALALEYAGPDSTMVLLGRRWVQLEALAAQCRSRGAEVRTQVLDIREVDCLYDWMTGICATMAVDLIIVNAGVNFNVGPQRHGERWSDVQELLDVNIRGAFATINAAVPYLRARGAGQIAIISSLAAFRGLPSVPAYSASKAALRTYGDALRDFLAADGVRVNVVMPGYVDSPMCRAMPGPKPFLMAPAKAARIIRRGLESNRARIVFPFLLGMGTWALSILPHFVSGRILRWMGYGV